MNGKVLGVGLLGFTAIFAAVLWYFQTYAFYEIETAEGDTIRLVSVVSGEPSPIPVSEMTTLDADTSPLKYRACFRVTNSIAMLTESFVIVDDAKPLQPPSWFECFNAKALTEDLASGEAVAFLSEANREYGIDRIVAVHQDGRGFAWHQINACGTAAFDGKDLPAGCPEKPES